MDPSEPDVFEQRLRAEAERSLARGLTGWRWLSSGTPDDCRRKTKQMTRWTRARVDWPAGDGEKGG